MRSPEIPPPDTPPTRPPREGTSWVGLAVLVGLLVTAAVWNVRVFAMIVAVLLMIVLHELGHFVAARRAGMKVTEFFVGFGPRIWSFRRGEVEYGVKAILAGAYVRIIGMSNVDEVPPEDEGRTYRQKPYRQRMAVAVAGSSMHFALALVLMMAVFMGFGEQSLDRWQVDSAALGSAASQAGIAKGDRIVEVAGVPVDTHAAMSRQVRKRPGETVELVVERDGSRRTETVRLGARVLIIGTAAEDVSLAENTGAVTLNSVAPVSRQHDAGLRDGDRVAELNGVPVKGLADLEAAVGKSRNGQLRFVVQRGESTASATVDLGKAVDVTEPTGFLGVGQELVPERLGPLAAAGASVRQFGTITWASVQGLGKLFDPRNLAQFAGKLVDGTAGRAEPDRPTPASATNAAYASSIESRPISIVGVIGLGSQSTSWDSVLRFFAGINIVIGVINLIPLLPFDGGHVAVATYEKVRELLRRDGRRYFADAQKLMPLAVAVVMIMVTVGLLGVGLDIFSPIDLPR